MSCPLKKKKKDVSVLLDLVFISNLLCNFFRPFDVLGPGLYSLSRNWETFPISPLIVRSKVSLPKESVQT